MLADALARFRADGGSLDGGVVDPPPPDAGARD
jgi:hypothetical protein